MIWSKLQKKVGIKMKKFCSLIGVFLFAFLISSNTISAFTEESVSVEDLFSGNLLVDEDYILRDPITNKYSSDWSHLDTPENLQLKKDVEGYYSKLNSKLIQQQTNYENALNIRIDEFLSTLDPEIASFLSQENSMSPTASYDRADVDAAMVKILEGRLHLALSNLTPSNLASVYQNSNAARDHGVRYAQNNNFYNSAGKLITWDNAADTLRHFAWNYLNSNDLGVTKAKSVGDIHELALIALRYMNKDMDTAKLCSYDLTCMQTAAIQKTITHNNLAKRDFTAFNNIFDSSSVMDLINNEKGRLAYSQGNATYSVPFNRMLSSGELITTPNSIFSTQRRAAWSAY